MKEISCVHSVESVYIRRGISFTFIYKNILAGQVNANYFSMKSVPNVSFFFVIKFLSIKSYSIFIRWLIFCKL